MEIIIKGSFKALKSILDAAEGSLIDAGIGDYYYSYKGEEIEVDLGDEFFNELAKGAK